MNKKSGCRTFSCNSRFSLFIFYLKNLVCRYLHGNTEIPQRVRVRSAFPAFPAADILLIHPDPVGKLLLCESCCLSRLSDVRVYAHMSPSRVRKFPLLFPFLPAMLLLSEGRLAGMLRSPPLACGLLNFYSFISSDKYSSNSSFGVSFLMSAIIILIIPLNWLFVISPFSMPNSFPAVSLLQLHYILSRVLCQYFFHTFFTNTFSIPHERSFPLHRYNRADKKPGFLPVFCPCPYLACAMESSAS